MILQIDFSQISDTELDNFFNEFAQFIVDQMSGVSREKKPAVYDICLNTYINSMRGLGLASEGIKNHTDTIHGRVMSILKDNNEHLAPDTRQ